MKVVYQDNNMIDDVGRCIDDVGRCRIDHPKVPGRNHQELMPMQEYHARNTHIGSGM